MFILDESVMQSGLRVAMRLGRFEPDQILPYLEHRRHDLPSWLALASERGWIVRDDQLMTDPVLYSVTDAARGACLR